jgi:hypothetical protein
MRYEWKRKRYERGERRKRGGKERWRRRKSEESVEIENS